MPTPHKNGLCDLKNEANKEKHKNLTPTEMFRNENKNYDTKQTYAYTVSFQRRDDVIVEARHRYAQTSALSLTQ